MPRGLVRLGAGALCGAGVLMAVAEAFNSWVLDADAALVEQAMDPMYMVTMGLFLAGSFALLLGLVGLQLHQPRATGALGLSAFVVAAVGAFLLGGIAFASMFWLPSMAEGAPAFVASDEVPGPLFWSYPIAFISAFGGLALYALVLAWSGNVNRWAAGLAALGGAMLVVEVLLPLDTFVLAAGLAWLGIDLWRRTAGPLADAPELAAAGRELARAAR